MDTFNRVTGHQEIGETASSRPANFPEPPPIPETEHQLSHRASRASLPLNRQRSHRSIRSSKTNRAQDNNNGTASEPAGSSTRRSGETGFTDGSEDDFEWGPSHPCFPHPNPHCSPDSQEAKHTRVIRVRRDWLATGDLYPSYANLYPEILDPVVSESDFRFLISNLNSRVEAAFNAFTFRAFVDFVLGVLTGFIWDDFGISGAKTGQKSLEQFVDNWNAQKASEGLEVRLVQPRTTGFTALDFIIPDPGIDVVPEDGMHQAG
jgi:hypothetical protein